MIAVGDMLALADRPVGEELASQIGQGQCVRVDDPYEALSEMGRRTWQTVVLTAPRPDFAGLCRAARRLQRSGRLVALCRPAMEPEVRALVGGPLDDYFIYPLTRRDLARLRGEPAGAAEAFRRAAPALPARQVAQLLQAAQTVRGLEDLLAELVASAVKAPVAWLDADKAGADVRPLLLAAGPTPRALAPQAPLGQLAAEAAARLDALQECLPALLETARRTEDLHRLAITDHLTGACNRRRFYQATEEILQRAGQQGFRVTLLLYDIDNFKRYNDMYGHAAGDEILRDTAALMKQITRSQDMVARIGGDEFAVLFWDGERPRSPNSRPPESAYALADRFRRAVQRLTFRSLGPQAKGTLTISGGLATFPQDGQTVRELLRRADQALREAKRSGKNAIALIGQEP